LLFLEWTHSAQEVSAKLKTFTSGGSCANAFAATKQQAASNPQTSFFAEIQCLIAPMPMVFAEVCCQEYRWSNRTACQAN